MEFRCRLGTPGGEIIEGVYVADSEARLRREFEEKGLFVLALQQAGRASRWRRSACRGAARVAAREFLVFNQELATLLKAGMPLVQSLDILRRRVDEPASSRRCSTTSTSGCGRAASLSDAFEAHGALFPGRLHRVAARRREERQPRAGAAPLRRLREGRRRRQAEDDLRAGLSGDPARRCRSCVVVASSC